MFSEDLPSAFNYVELNSILLDFKLNELTKLNYSAENIIVSDSVSEDLSRALNHVVLNSIELEFELNELSKLN